MARDITAVGWTLIPADKTHKKLRPTGVGMASTLCNTAWLSDKDVHHTHTSAVLLKIGGSGPDVRLNGAKT